MFHTIRLLAVVSRLEFLPAMASWFTIGLSWGLNRPSSFTELVIPATLSFAVIMLSTLVGLQMNTIFDHELDCKDDRKQTLVEAMDCVGRTRLRSLMAAECLLGLAFVFLLLLTQGRPTLLIMWIGGMFLAYAYSAPPIRLKSRSSLSLVTLLLVICVLPVLFVVHTFTFELNPFFLLFLIGQALSVYSLILSTEVRDYFEDSAMGVETMTVRIGLVKASLLSIALLVAGGALTGTAFFLKFAYELQPILSVFLLSIAVADGVVLRELKRLYSLSREYATSRNQSSVAHDIRRLSARSPMWITLVSQAAVFMSLILIVSEFLL